MKYLYYPGCSLEGSAREYDISVRAVMAALGSELVELDDWTCCGASAADTSSYLLSLALPARNLALAERSQTRADVLVPCSACYLNLVRADDHMRRNAGTAGLVNQALETEGLSYAGGIRVRHLLDVLANDIGAEKIAAASRSHLAAGDGPHIAAASRSHRGSAVGKLVGMKVAPYYGCQALRPYRVFDDPERPASMDALIRATGADVLDWSMGARCCGAGLMTTKKHLALELVADIFEAAKGADCIVTICPMCQMNLDIGQKKISAKRGESPAISILYLPQLIGLGLGLPESGLRLDLNLAVTRSFARSLPRGGQTA
ncbi:MAG: CoB--CoM heterodisulfide reductase iron-sulfur subunit B family protein [Syntrophobacteraceae bacterium]